MGAIVDHLSDCNIQNFNSAGFIGHQSGRNRAGPSNVRRLGKNSI